MSEKKNDEVKNVVVKEKKVTELEPVESVDEKELKKAKAKQILKKTGKVLGIGLVGAVIGFIGGRMTAGTSEDDEEIEVTTDDYEVEIDTTNEPEV